MKKKAFTLAALLVFALSTAACTDKTASSNAGPSATEQSQSPGQPEAEETAAGSETMGETQESPKEPSQDGKITGTVEENKGFMITVISSADSEAYVFTLDETQSETYQNIKAGDKITVSYTKGLPTPDNLETIVTEIQSGN